MGTLTKPRLIILVISGMLACLLRNNMIYAMLVWVALLMLFGKGVRRIACYALIARHIEHRRQSGVGGGDTGRKGQYPRNVFRADAAAFQCAPACA